MNLVNTLKLANARPAVASVWGVQGSTTPKVSKGSAGYVFRPGTDYRCADCWQLIEPSNRCLSHGKDDVIKPSGYCTYWTYGQPVQAGQPKVSISKIESGYGELPNGTKCRRCVNFDNGFCKKVDEKSPGDTPGLIHPNACCSLQEPRNGRYKTVLGSTVSSLVRIQGQVQR